MTTVVLSSAANVTDSQFPALTGGAAAPVILQVGVDAANQHVTLGANARAAGVTEVLYQPTSGATASNGLVVDISAMQSPMTLIGSGVGNTFMLSQAELTQTTINGGAATGGENIIGFQGAVALSDSAFTGGNISHITSLQLFAGNSGQTITLGPAAVAEGITNLYTDNANGTIVNLSGMVGTPGVIVRSGSVASITGSPGNDTYRFFMGDLSSTDTIHGSAGTVNKVELRDEGHIDDANFANMTNISIAALTFDHSGQSITLGPQAQAAGVRTVQFTSGAALPAHGYVADVSQMTVGMVVRGSGNNDTMLGGSSDDHFIIGPNSSDTINGGAGTDVAVFANPLSSYTLSKSSGVVTVFQTVHSVDTIAGVEQLQFADQTVSTASIPDASGSGNPGNNGGTTGTDRDDTLNGTGAADTILSGEGNDVITVGNGNELIVGGTMSNTANSAENDTITAGNGNSIIWGGAGSGSITVGDGNDLIAVHSPALSTFGNTVVHLGNGGDTVFAVGGNDTVFGGGGIDFIAGGSGSVSIVAGAGLTLMTGGSGASTLTGGAGLVAIFGLSGKDVINSGSGGGTIVASGGAVTGSGDTVHAGAGADFVVLNPGVETVITDLGSAKVQIGLGGFTAANQVKSIQIGAGHDTLVLQDKTGFSGDSYTLTGYKVGVDHIIVLGLAEHAMSDMNLAASGGNTVITTSDSGSITLVGVAPSQVTAADFTFS